MNSKKSLCSLNHWLPGPISGLRRSVMSPEATVLQRTVIILAHDNNIICDQWLCVRLEASHKQRPTGISLGTGDLQHLHQ